MDFLTFTWIDALDILLVTVVLYQLYRLVYGTVAMNIFTGILAIYFLWKVVEALNMDILSEVLGKVINVGIIALLIVFQPELRRFLLLIGTPEIPGRFSFAKNFLRNSKKGLLPYSARQIALACKSMSATHTGALIIIGTEAEMEFYIKTGEVMDAKITSKTLESVFFKNGPLHDGAVIICSNKIRAARCVLPVTERDDFPSHLGMRHRAAAGITENSKALAVIVSEQTGEISLAAGGKIQNGITKDELVKKLME